MGGYQQLIRGDVMRSRFRKSFKHPEPMTPGQVTPVEFTLPDTLHTFRRGHRIQVQIQSSWFPLVDRNPQTFVPNIARAQPSDFRKALHQLHHTLKAPSALTVRVLPNKGNSTAAQRAITLRCFLAWLAGGIGAQSHDSRLTQ